MFTVHVLIHGQYIPLVFVLLPSKSEECYKTVFEILALECNIHPARIVSDVEQAIHNAIAVVWPNAEVTGCRFHLLQAWYRKVQGLGLSTEYMKK